MRSYTLLIDKGDNLSKKGGVFMRVHLPENGGMTMIENTFIDQFMPTSSGDFVKIYLYLMRCAQSGQTDVSVGQIADALNYTESDVKRAMGYWQKQNCLELIEEADMEAQDLSAQVAPARTSPVQASFAQAASSAASSMQDAFVPAAPTQAAAASDVTVPGLKSEMPVSGSKITEFRPAAKHSKEDIRNLLFVAESYFGRPLSPNEQEYLVYFLNDLQMDTDLVDYLLDYCISSNHPNFRYIRSVALNWAQKGIRTVEQARAESSFCRKEYYAIFRSLGIRDHIPTPGEKEYMDRWLEEYVLPMNLILLACERTILQIGKAQLSYTDSILKSWHDSNVRTLEDVEALDQAHERTLRQNRTCANRSTAARPSAGRFLNIESSGTDWDAVADSVMKAQEAQERMSQES